MLNCFLICLEENRKEPNFEIFGKFAEYLIYNLLKKGCGKYLIEIIAKILNNITGRNSPVK